MKKTPLQIVKERFNDKAGLVAAVQKLTTDDLWLDRVNEDKGLDHVANDKLLRLHDTLTQVKDTFGSRASLIDAILKAETREKDSDYRNHFQNWSTPRLWDRYRSAQKRADRAAKAKA